MPKPEIKFGLAQGADLGTVVKAVSARLRKKQREGSRLLVSHGIEAGLLLVESPSRTVEVAICSEGLGVVIIANINGGKYIGLPAVIESLGYHPLARLDKPSNAGNSVAAPFNNHLSQPSHESIRMLYLTLVLPR